MYNERNPKRRVAMRPRQDGGMTLLEVVFAISILLIGVTFVVKSDAGMYRYRSQREITQQMFFYAAGQLERLLHNQEVVQGADSGGGFPINSFEVVSIGPVEINDHLDSIGVTVSAPNAINPPEPITLYTYKVK